MATGAYAGFFKKQLVKNGLHWVVHVGNNKYKRATNGSDYCEMSFLGALSHKILAA